MFAHNPLHGSGRAGFPHPALALGDDAHATQGIGMTDRRQWQPADDKAPHAIPEDAAGLAAPRQRAMPEPSHLESKKSQRRVVHGHSVIPDMSTYHRCQPLALFGDGFVHSSLKFGFHLVQLRLQPFAYRLPQHRKPSIAPLLHTDMREAKKVERLRLPFSTPLPDVDRIRTELQKSRLLRMQFQVELPHSFRKFRPKLIGIRFAVEAHHDVIGKSHDDHIAVRALLTPRLDPQVEYVMKIDVRQKRRSTSALGRPFLGPYSFPILQHAGPQPFLDESHDAPVCDPVLHELHQPFVRNSIEKAFDVQIEHPVHLSRQQSRIERIQRLMLASPWSEPVREAEKVRFVDSIQHLDRRALDEFVFQRRDSERSLPPVGLGDIHPTHRLRSVRSSLQPFGKVLEIHLQRLAVVPPRLPVHARRSFLLQSEVGHPQCFQVIDVVQERREPQLLILSCCLTVGIDFGRACFRVRWLLPWLSPWTSVRLPWLRFPKPPYDPGQPVFPGPVQTLAILRWPSRCQRNLSAGTHTSLPSPVYHRTRPLNEQRHSLAQWPAAVCPVDRQVPRAPLPGGDVTSAGAMSRTASKGITLSSLLLRAHAPARLPSAYFGLGLVWRIFAGYCQFLLRVGPSRRYLRETLLGCLDLCHGGIRSALARYFLHIIGLPPRVMGRLPTNFHPMTSWWALFSRLQPFLNVQTSKLACHPGHPYRNGIPVGQPWRLHPGRTCVVASTCTGYAIRPKRAIDGRGLSPHKSYGIVGYSYPLQRTRRVAPARCPERVLLWQVPFGPPSSLRPLRNRLPGVVRGLLRYYRAVRLPRSVRHRRTSLDFPMRPEATAALGGLGISRFPREVSAYVLGVSDRVGLWHTSRYRCTRWSLPHTPTASASRRKVLTRLNTRPARSPVNASTPPLRVTPHDSGPMWVATSHSCDFCIHYTSPVLTGAQRAMQGLPE